jgi:hypothetical protein
VRSTFRFSSSLLVLFAVNVIKSRSGLRPEMLYNSRGQYVVRLVINSRSSWYLFWSGAHHRRLRSSAPTGTINHLRTFYRTSCPSQGRSNLRQNSPSFPVSLPKCFLINHQRSRGFTVINPNYNDHTSGVGTTPLFSHPIILITPTSTLN